MTAEETFKKRLQLFAYAMTLDTYSRQNEIISAFEDIMSKTDSIEDIMNLWDIKEEELKNWIEEYDTKVSQKLSEFEQEDGD